MDGESLGPGNYCEYESMPSETWLPSPFSANTLRHMVATQFQYEYLDLWSTVTRGEEDCEPTIQAVVDAGPPIYLRDGRALPLQTGDSYVRSIWVMPAAEVMLDRLALHHRSSTLHQMRAEIGHLCF